MIFTAFANVLCLETLSGAGLQLRRTQVCRLASTYGMIALMESGKPKRNFSGLRVLSLESRRGAEMAKLIESNGGEAVVAPSMREVPLETNTEALEFGK